MHAGEISAAPAVRAEGLVKTYSGRGGDVEAVRGVDLHVKSGEVFGFLGPNGAGKSTTVRMLTTLMTITSGSARVAGIDVTADPDAARARIGAPYRDRATTEKSSRAASCRRVMIPAAFVASLA